MLNSLEQSSSLPLRIGAANAINARSLYQRAERILLGWGTLLILLVLWELAPALGWVNPLFTSSPSRIWRAAQWLFAHGFWRDIQVSAVEFLYGFGLSLLVGTPLGLLMGWYRRVHALFDPLITVLYAIPRVALLPVLILWLGIGIESKVAIVFLGGVFAILFNVMAGMKTLDEQLIRCARVFGATDRQLFLTVALPSILPFLIAGMKLAVGRSLIGVLVGELVAATAGVGHMMAIAGATFQTDKLFVGVVLLAGVSWSLTALLQRIENHLSQWRPQQ
ncbi:MAG: ABC transporter permease [Caldilineaceae bacterium]|nr:ABC transporter permease [Caldilineaceae bacterium]